MGARIESFRERLKARAALIGTFVKTPSPIVCEILARANLDVVCLDAEHAPFGRVEVDGCIAVLRAADQPSLVRLESGNDAEIRNALDSGANGILVPHVATAARAAEIARAARFGPGGRGFSGSARAAEYGTVGTREHREASDRRTAVVVQIEDVAALGSAAAIAATGGVDGLFVGRMDLAVGMGLDPADPRVVEAVSSVCAAGRQAGTAVGMYTPDVGEIPRWRAAGASFFLLESDQAFVLSGARRLVAAFRAGSDGTR